MPWWRLGDTLPLSSSLFNHCSYDPAQTASNIAAMMALGNFISAFVTNLPFVISPLVAVNLFIIDYLVDNEAGVHEGNIASIWAGVLLCIFGSKPFAIIFLKLIPRSLQAATAVGIGLLVSLSGAIEIGLIVQGNRTLVDMGELSAPIIIGLVTVVLIGVLYQCHIKGAFVIGLVFGSIIQWTTENSWPNAFSDIPTTSKEYNIFDFNDVTVPLIFSTFAICFAILVGITRAFSDLAQLTHANGHIPRARLLFIVCGIISIISGLNGGPPFTLSNETPVALKDGAKTGLSVLVSSFLFFILIFVAPLFTEIPVAGTMPILFMIGVFLIANAKKIEWTVMADALPAYFVIFIIPFTQSVLHGFIFGFVIYTMMAIVSGHFKENAILYLYTARDEFKVLFKGCLMQRDRTVDTDADDSGIDIPKDLSVADVTSDTILN